MVIKIAETELKTKFGDYRQHLFYDGKSESIALTMGEIEGADAVLCRVHSSCINAHNFNSIECDCREQMEFAQWEIQKSGKGIIVWLNQEGKGNGFFALTLSKEFKKRGLPQGEAYEAVGFKKDARDFSVAASILKNLGVGSVCLLTENTQKVEVLERFGVKVSGIRKT